MIKGLEELDKICDRIYNLDDVDYSKPMYFNDMWTDILKMLYTAKISESVHDILPKSIERTFIDSRYSIDYINRCSGERELGIIKRDLLIRLEIIRDDIYNNIRSIKLLYSIDDLKLLIYLMLIWEGIAVLREVHFMLKIAVDKINKINTNDN